MPLSVACVTGCGGCREVDDDRHTSRGSSRWPDGSYRQSPPAWAPGGVPRRAAWICLGDHRVCHRHSRTDRTSRPRCPAESRHSDAQVDTSRDGISSISRIPTTSELPARSRTFRESDGIAPDLFGHDLPLTARALTGADRDAWTALDAASHTVTRVRRVARSARTLTYRPSRLVGTQLLY